MICPTVLPYIGSCETTDGDENLPVEEKDVIGWAITGGIGLIGIFLNWKTRREAKQAKAQKADRLWSLDVAHHSYGPPFQLMALTYRGVATAPVHLENIRVVRPRGALIAEIDYDHDSTNSESVLGAGVKTPGSIIDVDAAMQGYRPGRGPTDRDHFQFYLAMPDRPLLSRREKSRPEIKVTISDISRSRRVSTVTVTSPPIHWANTRTDNAT